MKTLFYGEKYLFIEWTYAVGAHWNQCVSTTYVTEIKETYFEIYTTLMSIGFPLLNISNCKSVLKYLSLYGKLFIFTRQLYHQI